MATSDQEEKRNISALNVTYGGNHYNIPLVSPKYLKWLRSRQKMCREMATMMRVGEHPNIVDLYEVLELIQVKESSYNSTPCSLILIFRMIRRLSSLFWSSSRAENCSTASSCSSRGLPKTLLEDTSLRYKLS